MARIRDQAIVLRESDWSETSQVVTLLTEGHGKVRGLAKGSRRLSPSSVQRFSGGFEVATRGEVVAVVRPSSGLATITEWDLEETYPQIRRSWRVWEVVWYAVDLAQGFVAELDAQPGVFRALKEFLEEVGREGAGEGEVDGALVRYQWRVLKESGFGLDLARDVRRGGELGKAEVYVLDPREGGFTMEEAAEEKMSGKKEGERGVVWRVRRGTVEVLRKVARGELLKAEEGEERKAIQRANRLLCVYARAVLDQELPTMRWILSDRREGREGVE